MTGMLKHKYTDRICIIIAAAACIIAALFLSGDKLGITPVSSVPEYSVRIFDDSYVHHIDIQIDDWDKFLEEAPEEEYTECDVEIDGELFTSIGLRAKGNNSRRLVEEYGLDRYSLKIEFDHFQEGNTYYGLDKMSLDSSFQDNSYLKNYMTYDMMSFMGVPSPLCSYVRVTVNGEDWGLFLAVEEPEEAFARRNFGADYGMLYKPDYRSLEDANNDVALKYTTDNPEDYDNIFRHAKFDCTESDRQRLIRGAPLTGETQRVPGETCGLEFPLNRVASELDRPVTTDLQRSGAIHLRSERSDSPRRINRISVISSVNLIPEREELSVAGDLRFAGGTLWSDILRSVPFEKS